MVANSTKKRRRKRLEPLTPERAELVERYLPLAKTVAASVVARTDGLQEVIYDAAVMGLIWAAIRFDAGRDIRFSTYANHVICRRILGSIAREIDRRKNGCSAQLGIERELSDHHPIDKHNDIALFDATQEAERMLGRLPRKAATALRLTAIEGLTHPEAAARMGCHKQNIVRLLAVARKHYRHPAAIAG